MGRETLTVLSKTLSSNEVTGATSFFPLVARLAPVRNSQWSIQRIRIAARFTNLGPAGGGNPNASPYIVFTQQRGTSIGFCGYGAWPVAGVWKNRIQPENEIVWVGCVPPKFEWAPQIPVIVTESDALLLAMFDATDYLNSNVNNGQAGPSANSCFFQIRFDIDVLESFQEGY